MRTFSVISVFWIQLNANAIGLRLDQNIVAAFNIMKCFACADGAMKVGETQ